MAGDPDALLSVGLKLQDILAGLAGGVTNAFVFKRGTPIAVIGSIVVGALTANYLGEAASKITGTSEGAAAYIVGLCGMAVCQIIADHVAKWRPGTGP